VYVWTLGHKSHLNSSGFDPLMKKPTTEGGVVSAGVSKERLHTQANKFQVNTCVIGSSFSRAVLFKALIVWYDGICSVCLATKTHQGCVTYDVRF
jgi:hypothetical protein